jgi:hypothetical protein
MVSAALDEVWRTSRYPSDPGLLRLLADLRSGSPEFAALWEAQPAGGWAATARPCCTPGWARSSWTATPCWSRTTTSRRRRLRGAGDPEASALSLLTVVGTETFVPAGLVEQPENASGVPRPAR